MLETINKIMDAQMLHPMLTELSQPELDWVVAYSFGSLSALCNFNKPTVQQINALGLMFKSHLAYLLNFTEKQTVAAVGKIIAMSMQDDYEDHALYRFAIAGADEVNKMGTPEHSSDKLFELLAAERIAVLKSKAVVDD